MRKLKCSRMNESDSRYFNGYTDDTVPDVPGIGGIPQYNPMIVDDRIELMDDVIKELGDYWYSEDPKLEDEITRTTNREEVLYIKDIYWELDNPDVVTVKFGLAAFDGSNDRVAETREIDINFENFLGRDIEGDLVIFISKKIKSFLDSVLHGGLYKENKVVRELKRSRKLESSDDSLTLENARDLCKYIEHNCSKAKELCDLTYRKTSDGSIVINIDPIEGNYDDDLDIDLANQSLFVFISDRGGYSKIRLPRVAEKMNMDDVAKLICTNDKFNDFLRKLKRNRMNESEQMSRKDVISYIKNLVGNYFYGEDEEGYLIVKCPSGSFRMLIADDLGNGVIALEEMVERGVAPMKDEKAIERLLKKHGIIK